MSKNAPKFYVVWVGNQTGVFSNWDSCKSQIEGVQGAKYKSFPSRAEAEEAYQRGYQAYISTGKPKTNAPKSTASDKSDLLLDSVSVDGAWNTATGDCEYQGVYTRTGQLLFRQGVFKDGTNNIVEFLAIVHALAYLQKQGNNLPIYSDSQTALSWIRQKTCKTNLERTKRNGELFTLIARAETWLRNNTFSNPLLKWETDRWGENPADFGRK